MHEHFTCIFTYHIFIFKRLGHFKFSQENATHLEKKNQIKCMQHNINNVIEQQQHQQQKGNGDGGYLVMGGKQQFAINHQHTTR
jgi:hypothetical protein